MIETRLAELGLTLPEAAAPSFNYVPVTLHGGAAYVAGQLPKVGGDVLVRGKAGLEARIAAEPLARDAREEKGGRPGILEG